MGYFFPCSLVTLVALSLSISVVYGDAGCCGCGSANNGDERMELEIGVRSYDGHMWYCQDGKDRVFDAERLEKEGDTYIQSLPENERPVYRTLKDGSQELYILNEGNAWVLVSSPTTGERHGYLLTTDGFHHLDTRDAYNPVEEVPGRNYRTKLDFTSVPTNFDALCKLGAELANGRVNGFNQPYKGTHFVIEFLLNIVDPETKATLSESSANWPAPLQLLDSYFYAKLGESAFLDQNIPRGATLRRSHISTKSGHSGIGKLHPSFQYDMDAAESARKNERMELEIGVRSYDGHMWYCQDGKDRVFDAERLEKEGDAYIQSLPENERPVYRTLKDGSQELYILNEGNAWVLVSSPTTGERHGYLLTTDGFHALDTRDKYNPVEEVPGRNYRTKLEFTTMPTNFQALAQLGDHLSKGKVNGFNQPYKGTHFVIDFVLSVVDPSTRSMLRESSANWPAPLQLLDSYFYAKLGESAFLDKNIARGKTLRRSHISTKKAHSGIGKLHPSFQYDLDAVMAA